MEVGHSDAPALPTGSHCGFCALLKGTLNRRPSRSRPPCPLAPLCVGCGARAELGHLQERRCCCFSSSSVLPPRRWRRCVSRVEQVSTAMHYKCRAADPGGRNTHRCTSWLREKNKHDRLLTENNPPNKDELRARLFLWNVQHAVCVLLYQVKMKHHHRSRAH